jgi:hypothetical protein
LCQIWPSKRTRHFHVENAYLYTATEKISTYKQMECLKIRCSTGSLLNAHHYACKHCLKNDRGYYFRWAYPLFFDSPSQEL